jgi:hypothetical protein
MSIFDRDPEDWLDLQRLVAQLFYELGCEVSIGARVPLVRGQKEIDVLVRDSGTVPSSTYLCECKYWAKAIPQEVVHAFRTVVSDFGANRGFIVSRAGFQSGAREAIVATNIELVTFAELQAMYFNRWKEALWTTFSPCADFLFPYHDYLSSKPFPTPRKGNETERQQLLYEAYRPLLDLGPLQKMEGFMYRGWLPMTVPSLNEAGDPVGTLTIRTMRELYDFCSTHKDSALRHFRELHGERVD